MAWATAAAATPWAGFHADVRSGIIDAAAKFAAGVIEQQLIPSILRLNYGDTDEAPTLTFQERTEDDLTARAQWIATLAGAGAGGIIPLDWLGKTFGIPKPEAGEATLAEPEKAAMAHPPEEPFAAADNWNPELHPRDSVGKFARVAGTPYANTSKTEAQRPSRNAYELEPPRPKTHPSFGHPQAGISNTSNGDYSVTFARGNPCRSGYQRHDRRRGRGTL